MQMRLVWLAFLVATLAGGCDRGKSPAEPTVGSGAVGSAAPDPWAGDPTPVKKDPLAAPLFWSATKDGKTTYFLGTMHLGVDAERRMPDSVFAKLSAAPTFAMETDLSDPAIAGMVQRSSGTLHEDLGPEYWKKLEDTLTPGVAKSIDAMKPMVAASLLAMRGVPMTPPMDRVLLARAEEQKKQIVYLEPATLQASVLEKYQGVRELKAMLDIVDTLPAKMQALLAAYVAGDETKLVALSEAERADQLAAGFTQAELDESNQAMIYGRNAAWIEPIEKLHAAGGGFVAVGALHLVGPKSVLELLQQRGYTIARVAP
jgi:uncharacterized protein